MFKKKKRSEITKTENHKFLFDVKMKPHMIIFLATSVLSYVTDTLCNILVKV